MTTCLVGLGSNLGDRTATLDAAIGELRTSAGVQSVRASAWQMTLPVGGAVAQPAFLNGAARFETSLSAIDVLEHLQKIERRLGRERHERWGSRTLDLDLLLFGGQVIETPALTVPHPRMSFRRFVLEPAIEVAGDMLHPTIGCTISQLLDHLESGIDYVAIVSHDAAVRADLAGKLVTKFHMQPQMRPNDSPDHWPDVFTSWLSIPDPQRTAGRPKLTVILHEGFQDANRGAVSRGPTLRVPAADGQSVEVDVFAAVEAVWPHLGRQGDVRLQ